MCVCLYWLFVNGFQWAYITERTWHKVVVTVFNYIYVRVNLARLLFPDPGVDIATCVDHYFTILYSQSA